MAQGVLSAANEVQARDGNQSSSTPCEVYLPSGTQEGSTVTVEMVGPALYPGMPDGWEYDATDGARMWVYRRRLVAAGEGVQGSTGWTFDTGGVPTVWAYRVTEWDAGLEPQSPLEAKAAATVTGIQTSVSTGTTWTTSRPEVVALAMHYWSQTDNPGQAFNWSDHTNSFTERSEMVIPTGGTSDWVVSWSWLFASATGTFECSATPNTTPKDASDLYRAVLVVYAATTYAD